ncbi:hypothetical protein VKT23_019182 [Stygiomarasmius scandens]|uniref:Uncharacterized protein n=1 Tax=Marasmiellus scandens TaxID=2682957 RepID=A0ABR1IPF3_9AGAR
MNDTENAICPLLFVQDGCKVVYRAQNGSVLVVDCEEEIYPMDSTIPQILHAGANSGNTFAPSLATWSDVDEGVEYIAVGSMNTLCVYRRIWDSASSQSSTPLPSVPLTLDESSLSPPVIATDSTLPSPPVIAQSPLVRAQSPPVRAQSPPIIDPSSPPARVSSPVNDLPPGNESSSPTIVASAGTRRTSVPSAQDTEISLLPTFMVLAIAGLCIFGYTWIPVPNVIGHWTSSDIVREVESTRSGAAKAAFSSWESKLKGSGFSPATPIMISYETVSPMRPPYETASDIAFTTASPDRETVTLSPTTITNYNLDSLLARPEWGQIATLLESLTVKPTREPSVEQVSKSGKGWGNIAVMALAVVFGGGGILIGYQLASYRKGVKESKS